MAVWHSASSKGIASSRGMLRGRLEVPRAEASHVEPEIGGKWHPAMSLAFIVASCSLLWAGTFAVIVVFF